MNREQQASLSVRVGDTVVAWRHGLFLLATLATALLATGILRTSFDTSLSALLSESDPYVDELDRLAEDFPSESEVVFAFVAAEGSSVFSASVLAAIADLKTRFTEIPGARRMRTILEYTSPESQRRLFSEALEDYSLEDLQRIQATAVADPFLTSNLLSSNGMLTFANVLMQEDADNSSVRLALADAISELRDSLRQDHGQVTIYTSSDVLLEQASQRDMVADLTTLLPIVILMCVLVICYCFKSITLGACILTHVGYTIVATVGLLGFFGFSFNNISVTAPLVVVIIAVANSVHIISIYKQALHKSMSRVDAMTHSMAYNFQPISLAALTTAIGFTSLNLCSSPAVQDFGRIVAVGIVLAYLLTLAMLPALLIWFSRDSAEESGVPFLQQSLASVIAFTERRDRPIFWFCTALGLATLIMLPLNETDFDRLDYLASDPDIRGYFDVIGEHLERGPSLTYGIDTGIEDAAIDPEFLQRVDTFIDWLDAQPAVESIISLTEILKTINQIVNENDNTHFTLPEEGGTVGNYLNAYRTVESNYLPLASFLSADNSHLTVFINGAPMTNQEIIDLDEQISAQFQQIFPTAQLVHGSGILLFARMDELVTVELLQGYTLSLILITLCLIVGFRSTYFGLLSVLPNLLPATVVFGIWALLVGQLDPFVMMLFSISIGLVVDDTVHILSHYLEGRRAGADKPEAIAHSIRVAGPALSITTMVLAFGTTVLIFANTLYFQQSAKLLVPIVILALVLDLVYLPTILKRFDNRFPAKPGDTDNLVT